MYAAWRNYQIVTDSGARTEVLSFSVPSYAGSYGYWSDQWLASPGNTGSAKEVQQLGHSKAANARLFLGARHS